MDQIKKFVQEHKNEIVIITISTVVMVVMRKHLHAQSNERVERVRLFVNQQLQKDFDAGLFVCKADETLIPQFFSK